jgi:ubiquinone/menaquinone biosynthesis C-methylase UbiE
MGFYARHVLPRVMDWSCGAALLTAERRKVVPQASGRVLELGIGSGRNLPLYDAGRVASVTGIDPSAELLRYTRERARGLPFPVELVAEPAETAGLPARSFDTVVVTYTLCTIPDVARALDNLRPMLKPGGRLLFLEHGAAPDAAVRRWQARLSPLWLRLAGGCHLLRDAPTLLREAGFAIERLDAYYMPAVPRLLGYHTLGSARLA